jgi:probable phosphoglycerate mutase
MSAVLILVRHGETSANVDGVWHGSTDTPLTPRGHTQAERIARHLEDRHTDAQALYSSPLRRARDTAAPIARALSLEPRLDPDLREYDIGRWEGKSFAELYTEQRFFEHIRRDPDFAPHGGESPREVTGRLSAALERIAAFHAGERVVVIVHGGALSMALAHLLEGDYTRWQQVMGNCALTELVLEPEPSLLSFNQTQHLADL